MAFNPVTVLNYKKYGPTFCIALGSSIALTGILASTYVKSYWLFTILYGGLFGMGIGLSYMAPLICCWEHFPKRRGLVSGIIIGAFGFGSFAFNILSTYLINKDDKKPIIAVPNGGTTDYFYHRSVANKAPVAMRILVAIWAF